MFSIAQLFALGLAASTVVNGQQALGNAGVARRAAVSVPLPSLSLDESITHFQ